MFSVVSSLPLFSPDFLQYCCLQLLSQDLLNHTNNQQLYTRHCTSFGSSAIHLPSVKSIGWTVVEKIEGRTDRDSFHFSWINVISRRQGWDVCWCMKRTGSVVRAHSFSLQHECVCITQTVNCSAVETDLFTDVAENIGTFPQLKKKRNVLCIKLGAAQWWGG